MDQLTLTRNPAAVPAQGAEFEYLLAALLVLRALTQGLRFQLFANVKAVNPLDDLVLRVLSPQPSTVLFQLKHSTKSKKVDTKDFMTEKGDYGLPKYFVGHDAFCQRHQELQQTQMAGASADERVLHDVCGDDVYAVLYTTRSVRRQPGAAAASDSVALPTHLEALVRTNDCPETAFCFGPDDDKVWALYDEDPARKRKFQEFLSRFRVLSEQADVKKLKEVLLSELNTMYGKPLPGAEKLLQDFVDKIKDWTHHHSGCCLSHESRELEKLLLQELQRRGREAAHSEALRFGGGGAFERRLRAALRAATGGGGRLLVATRGVPQGLRAAKILQLLDHHPPPGHRRWGYVGDAELRDFPQPALLAALSVADVLVLDADKKLADACDLVNAAAGARRHLVVIVVMSSRGEASRVESLPGPPAEALDDNWTLEQLTADAQNALLDATVSFQGKNIPLSELESAWPGLRGDVDGPLLSKLLKETRGDAPPVLGILPSFPDDDSSYIDRCLVHESLLRPEVLTSLDPKHHLFTLSGLTEEEFQSLSARDKPGGAVDTLSIDAVRLLRLEDFDKTEREKLLEYFLALPAIYRSIKPSMHWIARRSAAGSGEGALVWMETHGDQDALAAFVQPLAASCKVGIGAEPQCVHETAEASAWERRALLLVDQPGAGKSSFVARAAAEARSRQPARWHVVVPLLAHWQLLDAMPQAAELTKSNLLTLVAAAGVDPGDQASRRCLEAALFRSGAVTVYVDGVDEVVPKHKDKAMRLLQLFLQQTHPDARLWVASRPEVEAPLMRVLDCVRLSFVTLERSQQLRFIAQKWESSLSAPPAVAEFLAAELVDAVKCGHVPVRTASDHPLEGFKAVLNELFPLVRFNSKKEEETEYFSSSVAKELIEMILEGNISENGNGYSLLENPLYLKLAVEGFQQAAKDALASGGKLLGEKLNRLEIFDRFFGLMRKNFEEKHGWILVNPSTRCSERDDDLFEQFHQMHALKIYSTSFEVEIPWLTKELEKWKNFLPKEKTGILWVSDSGELEFEHFVFIECCVSRWLHSNLFGRHSEQAKSFLRALLAAKGGGTVLGLLDERLCKGRPVHQAVLQDDAAALQEALAQGASLHEPDLAGRLPLHVATLYGRRDAIEELLKAGEGANLEARDALLDWTPLQHAEAAQCFLTMELLLSAGANRSQLRNDVNTYKALITAAILDLPEVFHCYIQSSSPVSNAQLLRIAVYCGSVKVIKKVFEADSTVGVNSICGQEGSTLLHIASCRGHKDVEEYLRSKNVALKVEKFAGPYPYIRHRRMM